MANNSSKGAARLADVLQSRMVQVMKHGSGVIVERGEIVKGRKLKLYSIPDSILDRDDYSVCMTVYDARPLKVGDRVLIVWTFDGEPVVIDRIAEADSM
jgi:hypothetical protein